MRIIGGDNRGRKLAQIEGWDIRPTSDRVREALFNILGPAVRGCRVLDLFAGTGAFGLEALSRGAEHTVFVESASASCAAITENIQRCRRESQSLLVREDATTLPRAVRRAAPFDIIFMDPPYHKDLAQTVLDREGFAELLAPDGVIIAEQAAKEPPLKAPAGLDIYRDKKYSKTRVTFFNAV